MQILGELISHPQPGGGCVQELASQLGLRTRTTEALLGPKPSFRKQGYNVTSTLGQVHAKQVALSNTPLGTPSAQACVSQPTCPYFLRWECYHHLTLKLAKRGHTEGSWWVSVAVLPKQKKASLEVWRIDISAQGQPQKRAGSNNSNSWEMSTRKTLTPRFY